jgi:hypothetical protein
LKILGADVSANLEDKSNNGSEAGGCEALVISLENRGIPLWIIPDGIAVGGIGAADATLDMCLAGRL